MQEIERRRAAAPGLVSPGRGVMLLGLAHAVWGWIAHREALRELGRTSPVRALGDGIFEQEHARDERAAGFWFMSVAPLLALVGYLVESALRAGDDRALTFTGRLFTTAGAAGLVLIRRSGSPGLLALGLWMGRRGRRMRDGR